MTKPKKTRLYMKTFTFYPGGAREHFKLGVGPCYFPWRFTHFPNLFGFVWTTGQWIVCTRKQFKDMSGDWYEYKDGRKSFPKNHGREWTLYKALQDHLEKKGVINGKTKKD